MKRRNFLPLLLLPMVTAHSAAAIGAGARTRDTMSFNFNGAEYVFRWAKNGQYEFTPPKDSDLTKWKDMVTVNLHEGATSGEKLADVANKVMTNYQRAGKILRTNSKPRTASRPAEHLIVAVLGNPEFLEAAFARLMLVEGAGVIAVYSHRIYGKAAGPAMSEWLKANGTSVEKALVTWDKTPSPAMLKKLPARN